MVSIAPFVRALLKVKLTRRSDRFRKLTAHGCVRRHLFENFFKNWPKSLGETIATGPGRDGRQRNISIYRRFSRQHRQIAIARPAPSADERRQHDSENASEAINIKAALLSGDPAANIRDRRATIAADQIVKIDRTAGGVDNPLGEIGIDTLFPGENPTQLVAINADYSGENDRAGSCFNKI